jgi:hypothetical protein
MVFARNYGKGEKWIHGTIVKIDGPLSYVVKCDDGALWKRHIDQLRGTSVKDVAIKLPTYVPPIVPTVPIMDNMPDIPVATPDCSVPSGDICPPPCANPASVNDVPASNTPAPVERRYPACEHNVPKHLSDYVPK